MGNHSEAWLRAGGGCGARYTTIHPASQPASQPATLELKPLRKSAEKDCRYTRRRLGSKFGYFLAYGVGISSRCWRPIACIISSRSAIASQPNPDVKAEPYLIVRLSGMSGKFDVHIRFGESHPAPTVNSLTA